jgi:hypothetical protein
MWESKERLLTEIERYEKRHADALSNLARVDDPAYSQSINRDNDRAYFKKRAEELAAHIKRLRRFAEAW